MKAYGFDVPEGKGYKWAAVDEDGGVYVFKTEPVLDTSMEEAFWNNPDAEKCALIGNLGYYPNYKNSLIELDLIEDFVERPHSYIEQALQTIQQFLQGTYEEVMITRDEIAVISNDFVERKGTPEQIVRYIENRKECCRIVAEMAEN